MKIDIKHLNKMIKSSGLRKNFIAEKSGIHRAYLWMIMNGERTPKEEVLINIYKVLIGEIR